MSRETKGIVHDGTMRDTSTPSSIDVFDNIGFNQSGFVVTLDVSNNLDGHSILLSVSPTGSRSFEIYTFHHPTKGSHSHFSNDAISIGNDGSLSSLEVTNSIIMA